MDKIKHISNDLKDWISNTLKSGVNPESIVDAMIKKGFDTRFAYNIILRMIDNKPIQTTEIIKTHYDYETPAVGKKGNLIYTSDREIKVLMRMESPFILYLDNVLDNEECDSLISLSKDCLQPSYVIDPKTGEEQKAAGRTSKGMYFNLNENALISTIERRVAEIINFPIENGEGLQVLNYQNGEQYKPHYDYFPESKIDFSKGGQRVGTLLIYLNDVPNGGETIFPKAGLSFVPKKGTAIYFQYGNSKGQVDHRSLHSSSPVLMGEKWVATKWIRQGEI